MSRSRSSEFCNCADNGRNSILIAGLTDLDDMERTMILKVLTDTDGQHQRVAEMLGISLRTLSRKLKAYGEAEPGTS